MTLLLFNSYKVPLFSEVFIVNPHMEKVNINKPCIFWQIFPLFKQILMNIIINIKFTYLNINVSPK